jgi:hypothetical protein
LTIYSGPSFNVIVDLVHRAGELAPGCGAEDGA